MQVAIKDATFLRKFPWQCLIVDEGHRLKNSASVLHNVLKEVCCLDTLFCCCLMLFLGAKFSMKFRVLLTGTPVQNNLNEVQ